MLQKAKVIGIAGGVALIIISVLGFVIHEKDMTEKLDKCKIEYGELQAGLDHQNSEIDRMSSESMAKKDKAASDYKNRFKRPSVKLKGDTMGEVDASALKALQDEQD